jgi:primosomal protein N' (replication factor Y)
MLAPVNFVNVAVPPLDRCYTYCCTSEKLIPGQQVSVPLGNRKAIGFVIEVFNENPFKTSGITIKEIKQHDIGDVCFNEEQIKLFRWISSYYCCPLGQVIETALPKLTKQKTIKYIRLIAPPQKASTGDVQCRIIDILKEASPDSIPIDTLKTTGASYLASLKRLASQGIIEITEKPAREIQQSQPNQATLNSEQEEAFKSIRISLIEKEHQAFLLHGITGSGKTEVYINLIIEARKQSLGCLVLVPEISLTPQLIARLEERIGESIAVLHSALRPEERSSFWRDCLTGRYGVVLGARSAVFAPVNNLGLVIIDEEHDPSFKQSDSLRYNGRDTAIVRALFNKCPVVLGSATPSLESYLNAKRGKYKLLELTKRHGNATSPTIQCVDLSKCNRRNMQSPHVSNVLYDAVNNVISDGNQVFLLYNRRGFASFLLCDACGTSLMCHHCEVTLTYHQSKNLLVCHYCNRTYPRPSRCPKCSAPRLELRGAGTEKIYSEIQSLFPSARIERLDRDRARKLEDYRSILAKVQNGEIDILVGTQMIAKGHNLPGVTLVGILDCDIGLNMPDFRATEKSFALLTQAAGRAGRGNKTGHVILQTYNPTHPSIANTLTHDYTNFALSELKSRQNLSYPPFWRLVRIVASGTDQEQATCVLDSMVESIEDYLSDNFPNIKLLGPSETPIPRIKDRWRYHVLIKCSSTTLMHNTINYIREKFQSPKKIRLTFDIDPFDMM